MKKTVKIVFGTGKGRAVVTLSATALANAVAVTIAELPGWVMSLFGVAIVGAIVYFTWQFERREDE